MSATQAGSPIKGMVVDFTPEERDRALKLLGRVFETGWLMWGEMQERLQQLFCEATSRKHAVTFNSNTSAQEALFALLKPRRVAFCGNHYPSPAFAARRQGAEILWVDFDPVSLSPDLSHLRALRPHVFVLQETAGFMPENLAAIEGWCIDNGVLLVEDCGQSVGSQWRDSRWAGSFGDVGVFSLAGTKALTAGQGGVIVMNDEKLAADLFMLKNAGRREMFSFDFEAEGYNTHMTELQAALAVAMFETVIPRRQHRAEAARIYDDGLPEAFVRCGYRGGEPNWFKYPILLPEGVSKDQAKRHLAEYQIGLASSVYDEPSYQFAVWRREFQDVKLSGTERFCARHVCLPMHNLLTPEDASRVVAAMKLL